MLQKDYFQRLIEEAAEVLATLLGLRQQGNHHQAQTLLDESLASLFDLNGAMLRQTEVEGTMGLLLEEGLEKPHLTALAELLREQAELSYGEGDWAAGDHALRQGLAIYDYLNEAEPEVYDFSRYNAYEAMLARLNEMKDNT